MKLIERLNELVDLSPDQIAANLGDPIRTPVSMATLGLAGIQRIEGRLVHFLEYCRYDRRVKSDSGAEGEIFRNDGVYTTWAEGKADAGHQWHIISHEAFLSLDLENLTLPPRP